VLPADNGEFQLVAWKLGIAHPPGYPLYTMIGWLFSRFFASPAFALNLLSAILAAITLVIVNRTVRTLTRIDRGRLLPLAARRLDDVLGASHHGQHPHADGVLHCLVREPVSLVVA
jgi:hypothetical protein